MMPRPGRPRKKSKGRMVNVFLESGVVEELDEQADRMGVSRSQLIEDAILFILRGHSQVAHLRGQVEELTAQNKVLREELERLTKENERLAKKIEKMQEEMNTKLGKNQKDLVLFYILKEAKEGMTWAEIAVMAGIMDYAEQAQYMKRYFMPVDQKNTRWVAAPGYPQLKKWELVPPSRDYESGIPGFIFREVIDVQVLQPGGEAERAGGA